jgi:glycosyltransferase involved in cell wall biosynthesis
MTSYHSETNFSSHSQKKKSNGKMGNGSYKKLYEYMDTHKNEARPFLSIILPVYNEQNTIKKLLESLPHHEAVEIIVVDDHSTDNSLVEIKKVKDHRNLHVLEHRTNRGYGAALNTGIHYSKGEIFITMDSDGQHHPKDIFTLVEPILGGEADITIGSRYKGSYNYDLPILKRFGEAILEIGIRFFFGQKVKNNQSGFRAFHRKAFPIFENIRFEGYAFTTELILAAALRDLRIKEVPIHLFGRKHGSSYIVLSKLLASLFLCMYMYILLNGKRLFSKRFYL